MSLFETKYRIARDRYFSGYWAVQERRWWWPFWCEVGSGLLPTVADAKDLIDHLKTIY